MMAAETRLADLPVEDAVEMTAVWRNSYLR